MLDCSNLQQLCIDDGTYENFPDNTECTTSHIVAEDMPLISENDKTNLLKSMQASNGARSGANKVLLSYFINVFAEPAIQEEDTNHVARLLKDYQKREGCSVKDMLDEPRFVSHQIVGYIPIYKCIFSSIANVIIRFTNLFLVEFIAMTE